MDVEYSFTLLTVASRPRHEIHAVGKTAVRLAHDRNPIDHLGRFSLSPAAFRPVVVGLFSILPIGNDTSLTETDRRTPVVHSTKTN